MYCVITYVLLKSYGFIKNNLKSQREMLKYKYILLYVKQIETQFSCLFCFGFDFTLVFGKIRLNMSKIIIASLFGILPRCC